MNRRSTMTMAFVLVAAIGLEADAARRPSPEKPTKARTPAETSRREAAYRQNNLGVAYLEQYDHRQAVEAFDAALAADPSFDLARVNRVIALFYVPDIAAAKAAATEALARLPDSPRLSYVLALIARLEDEPAEAERRLRRVLALDADDFGANLVLGQVLIDEERYDDALPFLDKAAALEPSNVSVLYSRAMCLGRAGRREESLQTMRRFQELRANPAHTSFGKAYLEQGRYAEAVASTGAESGLVDRRTPAVRFVEDPRAVPDRAAGRSVTLFLADVDGDGRLDALEAFGAGVRLLRNDGGRFTDVTTDSGLAGPARAALAGDYDDDGRPDVLLVRPDGLWLGHNEGGGRFRDVTAAAGLPRLAEPPATAAMTDLDHDGDLDVFLPGRLLQNNGDGTFTDVTAKAGVEVGARDGLAVAPTDYDNGRDMDVLLLRAAAPVLLKNERDGTFRDVAAAVGLDAPGPLRAMAVADWNKDSYVDVFFGSEGGASTFALSDGRGRFKMSPAPDPARDVLAAQAIDYDNDGLLDLLVATAGGPRLLRNVGSGWVDVSEAAFATTLRQGRLDGAALGVADLDGDGDEDVLVATPAGARLLRNDGGSHNRSFTLRLEGRVSNKEAVGAKIDMRSGSLMQKIETSAAVPMAAPADVLFGLDGREAPDTVRVIWVSGIVQTEIAFPDAKTVGTRTAATLLELDRKPSSCPYLYAWNGERFEFVTDFLGAGEMGYWVAPGVRSEPDPVEYVRIAPDQLREAGGRYELRVTNELEEVLYLDQVRLITVDHPRNVSVFPDEGMTHHPKAFRLFAVKDPRTPRVTDASGHDATERARALDASFVEGFPVERVRGYAKEHAVLLDLAPLPASHRLLLLTGWTDYAFSSDNVAASQMGLSLTGPRLEVETSPGRWETAIEDVGVPVGRPQTLVVDLSTLQLGRTARIRLATTMRVYWDRIAVGESVPATGLRRTVLEPTSADLHERGFSKGRSAGGFEAYRFDYAHVTAWSPWKTAPGRYTREGDVRGLLQTADDLFVVSKPGDEVALSFPAPPPPPDGWTRTFLLLGDGFSKEMDINSASPDVVLPLPYHGMERYPFDLEEAPERVRRAAEEAERWNSRVVVRPLPPLELVRLDPWNER